MLHAQLPGFPCPTESTLVGDRCAGENRVDAERSEGTADFAGSARFKARFQGGMKEMTGPLGEANQSPPSLGVGTSLEREESLGVANSPPQVCAAPVDHESMQPAEKFVEYWRWRYRDPKTGRVCRTLFRLTDREAAELPEAERIEGSMLLREVEGDDFPDTGPEVHRITPESHEQV